MHGAPDDKLEDTIFPDDHVEYGLCLLWNTLSNFGLLSNRHAFRDLPAIGIVNAVCVRYAAFLQLHLVFCGAGMGFLQAMTRLHTSGIS